MLLRYFLLKRVTPIEHLSKRAVMRARASSVKTGFPGIERETDAIAAQHQEENYGRLLMQTG